MLGALGKMSLAKKIGIAMVLGAILGIIIGPPAKEIKFIGDIWLNLLKMSIIPMVIFIVVKGITSMDSPKTLGRVGLKIASFYAFTTIFATLIAITVTLALKPGVGFQFAKATEAFKTSKILGFKEYITTCFLQIYLCHFIKVI